MEANFVESWLYKEATKITKYLSQKFLAIEYVDKSYLNSTTFSIVHINKE